jgi:Cu-Zn family superoxide dismutase
MKKLMIFIFIFFLTGCEEKLKIDVSEDENDIKKAIALLEPINNSGVTGLVYFNEGDGFIEIIADVDGLTTGDHGFHIFEYGDLSSIENMSMGNVYSVLTEDMANSPDDNGRIIGDLGSIYAIDETKAEFKREMFMISLGAENSILGRSIFVYQKDAEITKNSLNNSSIPLAAGVIGVRK